mgnify:CR=1 FL=1
MDNSQSALLKNSLEKVQKSAKKSPRKCSKQKFTEKVQKKSSQEKFKKKNLNKKSS